MEPIEFIPFYYYSTTNYFVLLFLAWGTSLYYVGSNVQKILHSEGSFSQEFAVIVTVLMSLFIGLRPMSSVFGDMKGYGMGYSHIDSLEEYLAPNFKTEWLWQNIQIFLKNALGLNMHEYFLFVAVIYYGGMLICSALLVRKNLWISMMFFLTAFSTYSYSTNGIRNGFACSLVLVAIALLALTASGDSNSNENRGKMVLAVILMLSALGIHRSTMLPSAAAIASMYVIKDTKWALRFWLASIAISLVAGPLVEQFFASLGFDDRMSGYYEGQFKEHHAEKFTHVGFRWDFLLYSSMPVALIWYATRHRKFKDPGFALIANTYLLCNAFWIMVIRAAFSNRFAYLSWFIHPLIFAYALMRMNLWQDQDRKTALIFFLYSGFTFFMYFIYYFGTTGFQGFNLYWWK